MQTRTDLRNGDCQQLLARQGARERAQAEALERLVTLLEAGSAEMHGLHEVGDCDRTDHLSQLARLRVARANYALSTSSELRRVGNGAWLHRRHA